VIDGKTQAFVFNCGSVANRGCTTHSTVPFTLTTAMQDNPLTGAVQLVGLRLKRFEHDTVIALI